MFRVQAQRALVVPLGAAVVLGFTVTVAQEVIGISFTRVGLNNAVENFDGVAVTFLADQGFRGGQLGSDFHRRQGRGCRGSGGKCPAGTKCQK